MQETNKEWSIAGMLEKQWMERLKGKKIVIYGAGMVGKLVFVRLLFYGLSEDIIGFAVSQKEEREYLGVPVYGIGELALYKRTANVIIATFPALHDEIWRTLQDNGFCHVHKVTNGLYTEMSLGYMENYRKTHLFGEKSVDILFVASDNNSSSGAFLCMVDLNHELRERGYSTAVILPEYGNGEEILLRSSIDYIYIPLKHWAEKIQGNSIQNDKDLEKENVAGIKEIGEFITEHNVRLVHHNTTYTYAGAVAALNKKIPFVWHIRENIFEQGFKFVNENKATELINKSSCIIAVSHYIKSCYKWLDSKKTKVVYDGVDCGKYYMQGKQILKNERVTILTVGVISPLKGQLELVEAAHILKEQDISFRILIVGSGDKAYTANLKERVQEYQLGREIVFTGRRENIMELYGEADVVVICSKSEAFGRTTIEAQLSGCVVIGANTGATSELVGDGQTGFLYEKGNSRELAEKIVYAISHPEKSQQIALAGQRHALQKYTRERNADEIESLYRQILSV